MLTQEQKDMIENNMGLVYGYCRQRGIYNEDVVQGMLLKICESIDKYDPTRGAYSTFVFMRCRSYLCEEAHKRKALKRDVDKVDNWFDFYDETVKSPSALTVEIDYDSNIVTRLLIDEYISTLSEKNKKIVGLRLQGLGLTEIAEVINCSKQNVERVLKMIRRDTKKWAKKQNLEWA